MLINKANLDAIFITFDLRYQQAYEETPNWWQQVASLAPSTARETHYGWIGRLPALREWLGERQIRNLQSRGYVLVNRKFEDSVGIPRTEIEDDQIGVYNQWMDGFGRAAKVWPDQLLTEALRSGNSLLCYDGQPFFHNAHPVDVDVTGGTTFQNNFDNTGTGGGVATALTFANYQLVRQTMMSYVGEDGLPLGIVPDLLVVPPQLEAQGEQILNMTSIAPAAALGANAASVQQQNPLAGKARLLVNPWLAADATTWYLMDTKRAIKPFVFQLRNSPEFTFMNKPDDPNVFLRDEYLFGVRARGAAGYSLPFLAARAKG